MNRIAEIRKNHGLSQTALAKYLGIAQNTLSQYETGYRNPTNKVIMNIADLFNVSVNEILNYPAPEKNTSTPSDLSLSNVTKVMQSYNPDQVNILLNLGWKLLHVGTNSDNSYNDGTFSAGTIFTLGWYGNPANATEYTPAPAGDEYGHVF